MRGACRPGKGREMDARRGKTERAYLARSLALLCVAFNAAAAPPLFFALVPVFEFSKHPSSHLALPISLHVCIYLTAVFEIFPNSI